VKTWRELGGFALAGLAALTVDLVAFNAMVSLGIGHSLANVVSSFLGLVLNFLINYRTFVSTRGSPKMVRGASLRFSVVTGASFLYLLVGFELFLSFYDGTSAVHLSFARIALIGSGTAVRFFLFRHWVFREVLG
jgi:putative flippase GtrA